MAEGTPGREREREQERKPEKPLPASGLSDDAINCPGLSEITSHHFHISLLDFIMIIDAIF